MTSGLKELMAVRPDWLKLGPESGSFMGFGANCHPYLKAPSGGKTREGSTYHYKRCVFERREYYE